MIITIAIDICSAYNGQMYCMPSTQKPYEPMNVDCQLYYEGPPNKEPIYIEYPSKPPLVSVHLIVATNSESPMHLEKVQANWTLGFDRNLYTSYNI